MRRIAGLTAVALFGATPPGAQYFGQNKVKYQASDVGITPT